MILHSHGVPSTSAARTSFSVRTPKAAVDWRADAENAFISPLLFDPQKKTLHSTLLSRAFAYRLSNWTPMDGGRFQ